MPRSLAPWGLPPGRRTIFYGADSNAKARRRHNPCNSLLTNLRLPDGGPAGRHIAITDGRIAAIMPTGSPDPDARQVLDLGGELVLPGPVDGHLHLDKTLFGLPWQGLNTRSRRSVEQPWPPP